MPGTWGNNLGAQTPNTGRSQMFEGMLHEAEDTRVLVNVPASEFNRADKDRRKEAIDTRTE